MEAAPAVVKAILDILLYQSLYFMVHVLGYDVVRCEATSRTLVGPIFAHSAQGSSDKLVLSDTCECRASACIKNEYSLLKQNDVRVDCKSAASMFGHGPCDLFNWPVACNVYHHVPVFFK